MHDIIIFIRIGVFMIKYDYCIAHILLSGIINRP